MTTKLQKQNKNQQMALYQISKFLQSKETINKMKRLLTDWEKVFTDHTPDKGLLSKIYGIFYTAH